MSANLRNGDVISDIKKRHTISELNESSYFNEMDWDVENDTISSKE